MVSFGLVNYFVLVVYFLALMIIGARFSGRQHSTADYFKGQGRIPWWAAGLSIYGTLLSAITFIAVPAKVFATDWSYFIFTLGIILVTPLIVGVFIPFYCGLNVTTAYEYLEKRFNYLARAMASFSFIVFQVGRVAVVSLLPSIAISVVTGIDLMVCIISIGTISTAYTLMGGIEAVIWTDVLQVVVLIGGAVLALVTLVAGVEGGVGTIYRTAVADDKFNVFNVAWDFSEATLWVVLIGGIANTTISYGTDQSVVQRYVTSTNLRDSRASFYINAATILPTSLLFFSLGTALYVFYRLHPERLDNGHISDDGILPWFIVSELPAGIAGLLIAGIFSAAMSTLSSSMNSSSAAYVTDFHRRLKPNANDRQQLQVARIANLLVGVLGTLMGLWMAVSEVKSLWDAFMSIIGMFTGGLAGLFLLGMFTTRTSAAAAVTGLLLSGITQWWVATQTSVHLLAYTATGIAACFVCGYVASWVFPRNEKDLQGLTVWTR